MNNQIEISRVNRRIIEKILNNHSLEQLNTVPEGFSNNLIWNIAHVVVTQQLLVYKLSGLPMSIDEALVEKYKKGSKTETLATEEDVEVIKNLLFTTLDKTQEDLDNGVFKEFNEYPTSAGYVLRSIADAISFNTFHEGIHLGYILALKKGV